MLVDVDGEDRSWRVLGGALAEAGVAGESQFALRGGVVLAARLSAGFGRGLEPPAGVGEWRLESAGGGTLEDLCLVACPEVNDPLGAGQVRVSMRAAGLNFRDVLTALSVISRRGEWDVIGYEGAGVVLEVGPGVGGFAVGDRVMGVFGGGFGPVAVVDSRLLVSMPVGWSFSVAASVPLVFLTAYYGLVDLARVGPGERVLIHSAAGGVGMAAVQLARYLGAEVFATASPGKWGVLGSLGLDETRVASSRDLEFGRRFLDETAGEGVDVVLGSLAGEFVDASLGLLAPRGGRYLEMGRTDVRDAAEIARASPGVEYRAFDLMEAGPGRIQEMLQELLGLFERGVLEWLPVKTWDVRRGVDAFRFLSQGRNVGKVVLTLPAGELDGQRTVLVTGGTSGLGGLVARHLVVEHGARRLVLASRRGREAVGAVELEAQTHRTGRACERGRVRCRGSCAAGSCDRVDPGGAPA